MLALSPSLFSTFQWPLEDPISHEQNYLRETETPELFPNYFPPSQPEIHLHHSSSFGADSNMVKKLNHNASERDRRKKINCLYSSLRSLLPPTDQMKKLSIPATVSRVLKYIPELQKEVERLVQSKEKLLSEICRKNDAIYQENQSKGTIPTSLSSVSASRISDGEVVIQISTSKVNNMPFSDILLNLQEDGLVLMNSSSLETSGDLVFYNLHLQTEGACKLLDYDGLGQKLVSLCEKRESLYS